jgi:acyl-CoA hydrolase/GNAT superfamily N-acetyltransferase
LVEEGKKVLQVAEDRLEENLAKARVQYPEKFASPETVFKCVRPGARIFVATGCGEPQYLVQSLINYVESNPKAVFDAELIHVVGLGVAPYTDTRFKDNFRCNAFFIGGSLRSGINHGLADYTPVFLSEVPKLISRGQIPIDIALIQTTPPDAHGYLSLGVSVDIAKAAIERAKIVIAQCNKYMPRVHGDGFVHINNVSYVLRHDEPIMEYENSAGGEAVDRIGQYVARLVNDGDVIQVGYGRLPNSVLPHLGHKRHLGVHTELLSDGLVDLIRRGVVDNSQKTINKGKTIASFCMGSQSTYDFIHDNSAIELKTIDYTNNPLVIATHHNMTAINSALEIDLTGQATAESIGTEFYSGIGGQADFMRGAVLAPEGKTILAMRSTAKNGEVSRIVPLLRAGSGVTLNRGDVHYVVTEYGIANLHGKNIRDRAMSLVAVAHPKFRPWLVEEAKKYFLVHEDQMVYSGLSGDYPADLETVRTTHSGQTVLFRSVKLSDEPLLKEFFYGLSERSMSLRFSSNRRDMPHERLKEFTVIDHATEMEILAILPGEVREQVVGVGWWYVDSVNHTAEVAFAVKDEYQNKGVGTALLSYLTDLAKAHGIKAFIAEVLVDNTVMVHVFHKAGFRTTDTQAGTHTLKLTFDRAECRNPIDTRSVLDR